MGSEFHYRRSRLRTPTVLNVYASTLWLADSISVIKVSMMMSSVRSMRSVPIQLAALAASVALCFTAAAIGSVAVTRTIETWYVALHKPSWNPPNWLFAPVWTTLYLLMAISAWLIWRNRDASPTQARLALWLFLIQLALNAAWSWIFFAFMLPGAALVEIVVLWIVILATIIAAWPISRTASLLLVPYLGWVTFASVLNATLWRLN
jgi:translocator protein